MMNAQIVIHNTLIWASLTYKMYRQKIVIYLFEKHITKNDEQWLENESYLSSEFL